jgi:hypothetical protein
MELLVVSNNGEAIKADVYYRGRVNCLKTPRKERSSQAIHDNGEMKPASFNNCGMFAAKLAKHLKRYINWIRGYTVKN